MPFGYVGDQWVAGFDDKTCLLLKVKTLIKGKISLAPCSGLWIWMILKILSVARGGK